MLDYSIAAIKMIYDELRKWCKIFKICFPIFTLAYYIYALVMGVGNLYVNIILISLFVVYTTFELATCKKNMKKTRKMVSKIYKWIKLAIKTFTLGSMLYGIYMASSNIDGISIILAVLMIILWVLQVLLEIIIAIIEPRARLVYAGVLNDAKPFVSKVNYVLPIFKVKKIIINTDDYQKELTVLEKKVELTRKLKKNEKEKVQPLKILGMMKKELKNQEKIELLENEEIKENHKQEKIHKKDKNELQNTEVADIIINENDVLVDENEVKKGKSHFLAQKGMEIVGNFFKKREQKQEPPVQEDDEFEKVKKLKELLDMGAITKKEFEEKKKQILGL